MCIRATYMHIITGSIWNALITHTVVICCVDHHPGLYYSSSLRDRTISTEGFHYAASTACFAVQSVNPFFMTSLRITKKGPPRNATNETPSPPRQPHREFELRIFLCFLVTSYGRAFFPMKRAEQEKKIFWGDWAPLWLNLCGSLSHPNPYKPLQIVAWDCMASWHDTKIMHSPLFWIIVRTYWTREEK